jgi:type IV secretion system protein VirD4
MPDSDSLYQLPTLVRREMRRLASLLLFELLGLTLLANVVWTQSLALRWGARDSLFGRPILRLSAYPSWPAIGIALLATFLVFLLLSRRPVARLPLLSLLVVPWYATLGPLYPPLAYLHWPRALRQHPALAPALHQALLLATGYAVLSLALSLLSYLISRNALEETGDTHGSARWATPEEIAGMKLADEEAPVVGAYTPPGAQPCYLHDPQDRHVFVFAPSGSGKSSGLVIPTLLSWPHSVLVLDVKAELWHHTAGYRARELQNRCLRWDPADPSFRSARYNPLFEIRPGPEDVASAMLLADNLVDPDGKNQHRDFWQQSAHSLLVGLILHTLYAEPKKTLAQAVHILADSDRTLARMTKANHACGRKLDWRDDAGNPTSTHPIVADAARALLEQDPRTRSGIVATALSYLSLYHDPVVAAATETSDFTPLDLVDRNAPAVSLYLTVAPAELVRLRSLIRITLNQFCQALTRSLSFDPLAKRRPLLLVLDEFTALGRLDFFSAALAYLRGYGIRVYISVQSLAQIQDVYGQYQSITTNCGAQVAFAPNDIPTAKLLSEMAGQFTVHYDRRSDSGGIFVSRPNFTHTEASRSLLTPDELRRLPRDAAITLLANRHPILGTYLPYFKHPTYAVRGQIPPPGTTATIVHDWSHWTGFVDPAASKDVHQLIGGSRRLRSEFKP